MTAPQLSKGDILEALKKLQDQIDELIEVITEGDIDPSLDPTSQGAFGHCGKGSQD